MAATLRRFVECVWAILKLPCVAQLRRPTHRALRTHEQEYRKEQSHLQDRASNYTNLLAEHQRARKPERSNVRSHLPADGLPYLADHSIPGGVVIVPG